MRIERPDSSEYAPYYAGYVSLVPDGDVLALLAQQIDETAGLLSGLNETRAMFAYAPGKWTIKTIVGHLADAERVFAYRALRFARLDPTPLPSFDENLFASQAGADARPLANLVEEFRAVRQSTLALYRGFTSEMIARRGTASDKAITVRALIYITAGHERHHLKILRERYLV